MEGLGSVTSALDGITVLDLTSGMAGALATMFLCDNGARLVRIEPPGGDPARTAPGYRVWDRGKESVTLDLAADGRSAFDRLVQGSDVLVESYAPSSASRDLVSYERLSSIAPRLVHCSITAYGRKGPMKDEPPIDDLVMARTGILDTQPSFRPGPIHVVHPLPSVGAGLLAAMGIVAALFRREKTGRGRRAETSLMAGALLYSPKVVGDKFQPRRLQGVPAGGGPFYSVFECADGEWVHIACIHGGFVDLAAAVMGLTELLLEPRFGDGRTPQSDEARQELFDIVAGVIKTKPYEEWARLFEDADVPYGSVRTTEQAMDNPQVLFNQMVIDLADPEVGPVSQMGLPLTLSGTPGRVKGPRATPGQHTDAVLLGLPDGPPEASNVSEHPDASGQAPPLEGVKVLELSNVIAGPCGGRLLADLGADVIKLERPEGEISRPGGAQYFYYLNAHKRSVAVDARREQGKEIVRKLAARSDVLFANLRPGATERVGIGPDVLRKINPGLIEAHVSAYGRAGPYVQRPGLDPLSQAMMGLQRAQGGPENPPHFLGALAPTDFTAGAMAALGATMALFVRERSGLAQRVDTNLLSGGIVLSSDGFMRYDGKPPRRLADKGQHGLDALHRLYEPEDGWLYLVAEGQDQWAALCEAIGRADLLDGPRFASAAARAENDASLGDDLARTFASGRTETWLKLLGDAGIACAPVADGAHEVFLSEPQAVANDMIARYEHPTLGQLKFSRTLVELGDSSKMDARPTPLLGQHTREALQELGYPAGAIDELFELGVVNIDEAS